MHIEVGLPFPSFQDTVAIAWDVTGLAVGPVTASVMVITCHLSRTNGGWGWRNWESVGGDSVCRPK